MRYLVTLVEACWQDMEVLITCLSQPAPRQVLVLQKQLLHAVFDDLATAVDWQAAVVEVDYAWDLEASQSRFATVIRYISGR